MLDIMIPFVYTAVKLFGVMHRLMEATHFFAANMLHSASTLEELSVLNQVYLYQCQTFPLLYSSSLKESSIQPLCTQ